MPSVGAAGGAARRGRACPPPLPRWSWRRPRRRRPAPARCGAAVALRRALLGALGPLVVQLQPGGARQALWEHRSDLPYDLGPLTEVSAVNEECLSHQYPTREENLEHLWQCCRSDFFLCWDVVHTFASCCKLPGGADSRLENITGVHLISFGSRHFAKRAFVLAGEALATGWFNTVRAYTPDDLSATFLRSHRRFLRRKARLGGYGIWKPHILLQRLAPLQEGEIVLYLDAGCEVNMGAGARFADYLRAAEQSPLGIFTFASSLGPQRLFTKGDLVEYLRRTFPTAGDLERVMEAPQHITGMIWVRKCREAIEFLKRWQAVMGSDYRLIDDSPSNARNLTGFREHRHDQSVFSMMLYALGHSYYIRDESLPHVSQREFAPIRASRLCGARHFLTADRQEWAKAGCIEEPGYMPDWAKAEKAKASRTAAAAAGAS